MGSKNNKLLVTGGSGFIGRNIVEQLGLKYNILAPTHSELELLDTDAVGAYLDKNQVDVVIHAAVRPGHRNAKDPGHELHHNTRMFYNLIRKYDRFKKMIYLGSGLVYDLRNYQPKMKEEYLGQHIPVDEGGFSKYIISRYIEKAENITELRVFGIFGRYEDYSIRFISNAICKTLFNLPITIKQNRRFDYIFIDDLMPVLEYFIVNKGSHKAYNVTPDHAIELKLLAEKVLAQSGKKLPIKIAQPGLGMEYSGDNSRIKAEINGLEFTPIDAAIDKLYGWYAENKAKINRELLLVDK